MPTRARDAPACFKDVGQALLDDAEGGQIDPRRDLTWLAVDHQLHLQSGSPDLVDQAADRIESGLRTERCLLILEAKQPQQMSHLAEGFACGGLHGHERLAGTCGITPERALRCVRLDRYHAETVGHHVVQLPGDAGPLLNDGFARHQVALQHELHHLRAQVTRP